MVQFHQYSPQQQQPLTFQLYQPDCWVIYIKGTLSSSHLRMLLIPCINHSEKTETASPTAYMKAQNAAPTVINIYLMPN